MSKKIIETVTLLAEPVAESLGLELWGVEFSKQESVYTLCLYIDKPGGITLDDCELMSKAIDPVLDEHDPIEPSYCLQVSSPGINRVLKRECDFIRYIGEKVKVKLYKAIGNLPRTFVGILSAYDGGKITVISELSEPVSFMITEAVSVRLEPDINF